MRGPNSSPLTCRLLPNSPPWSKLHRIWMRGVAGWVPRRRRRRLAARNKLDFLSVLCRGRGTASKQRRAQKPKTRRDCLEAWWTAIAWYFHRVLNSTIVTRHKAATLAECPFPLVTTTSQSYRGACSAFYYVVTIKYEIKKRSGSE